MKAIKFVIILLCFTNLAKSQMIYDFLNKNNQYDEQINWITNKIEAFKQNDSVFKSNGCCDIVIYPAKRSGSSEIDFLQKFLKVISEKYNYPLRVRYPILYQVNDVLRCDTNVVMHFNKTNDVLHDFQTWHNHKSVKYLYLIAPFAGDEVEPLKWPQSFTHSFMKIIIGSRVYRLTHPFASEPRKFERIEDSDQDILVWKDLSEVTNFNGKLINVSTVPCTPTHNWINDAHDKGKPTPKEGDREMMCSSNLRIPDCMEATGTTAGIMNLLSKKLNFTWSIMHPMAGTFGYVTENDTSDGILGDLHEGLADASICELWIEGDSYFFNDFIYPVTQTCIKFIVPRPIQTQTAWYTLFQQLQTRIWTIILLSFIAATVVCILFIQIYKTFARDSYIENFHTDNVIFELISILVTPNSIRSSFIPGYSMFLTCWSVYCFLIMSCYTSNLVSFLTFKTYSPRIDSAQEFVNANLTWGDIIHDTPELILDLNDPVHQKINSNFIVESYERIDLVEERIANGHYALLIVEFSNGLAAIFNSMTDNIPIMKYRIMDKCFFDVYGSIAFRYNSPYRLAVEKYHMQMFDSGILEKIKKDEISKMYPQNWESIYHEFDEKMTNTPEILTVDHILGAFILLGIGYGVSITVFIWEIWTAKYRSKLKTKIIMFKRQSKKK